MPAPDPVADRPRKEATLATARPEPERADRASDAAVIARSLDEPTAFAAIFDRHHEAIHRFLWSRLGGDRADDAAAEVFRIAFERRDDYDLDYASAKPWLFGIAANVARQGHRRAARHRTLRERLSRRGAGTAVDAGPEQRLHDLVPSSPVAAALTDLPERDRDPLLLYAWDELTYDEIARALDVPVGTVRSRISRARRQVRERLEQTAPDTATARGGDDE